MSVVILNPKDRFDLTVIKELPEEAKQAKCLLVLGGVQRVFAHCSTTREELLSAVHPLFKEGQEWCDQDPRQFIILPGPGARRQIDEAMADIG